MPLRRFLCLDEKLTNEYLAQAEGGLYDEEAQAASSTVDRKRAGGLKAGAISAEAGRSAADEEQSSRTVRQTPESAFTRLHRLLDGAAEGAQWLEALDDPIWSQLRRGEVLEIDAAITVPAIVKFGHMAQEFTPLVDAMKAFGEALPPDTEAAM